MRPDASGCGSYRRTVSIRGRTVRRGILIRLPLHCRPHLTWSHSRDPWNPSSWLVCTRLMGADLFQIIRTRGARTASRRFGGISPLSISIGGSPRTAEVDCPRDWRPVASIGEVVPPQCPPRIPSARRPSRPRGRDAARSATLVASIDTLVRRTAATVRVFRPLPRQRLKAS